VKSALYPPNPEKKESLTMRSTINLARNGLLLTCLWFAGCETPEGLVTPSEDQNQETPALMEASANAQAILAAQLAPGGRKDTPWQRMENNALASAISEAGGRVMIGFKDSLSVAGVTNSGRVLATPTAIARGKETLRNLGAQIQFEFKRTPAVVASIDPELVERLRSNPWVDYIEPSTSGSWDALPPDWTDSPPRYFRTQTTPSNITQVKADSAWATATGDDIKLLVIDSGIYSSHADLSVPVAWRCVSGDDPIPDQIGHGTHVAGIAAALDNTSHVVGVAHEAYLMSANVDDGNGAPDTAEIACSLDVARVNDVLVVNMSFSVASSTAITDEINGGYLYDDMVFVASAGNDGTNSIAYPGNLSRVVSVGAVNSSDARASFSNYGTGLDLMAPGVSILSTSLPGGSECASGQSLTANCSGTSMATAHVSGAATVLRERFPTLTNSQVIQRLKDTAEDLGTSGWDSYTGYGRIDVLAAVGLPSLTADILGDDEIAPDEDCSWQADPSGGIPPYTYSWWGAVTGSTQTIDGALSSSSYLWLSITDAFSQADTAQIYIDVDENHECDW
jgi:subtilisin